MKKSIECFRCERKFDQSEVVRSGGCFLCEDCHAYIEKVWPEEMAKEYNHQREKCKGCD